MADYRFGGLPYPYNQRQKPATPIQKVGFRLETIEGGQWVWAADVATTMHMQVILDRLAPLEGVRAVQPNGAIMLPGQGF